MYGIVDVGPARTMLILKFRYEVELRRDVSDEFFSDDVLPSLEIALVDALLEGIFPDACSRGDKNLTDWTFSNQQRRLESDIVGVRKDPLDIPTVGGCTYLCV